LARELLVRAAAVVYPSEFLLHRHLELFPGIPPERQRVIEPSGCVGGGPLPAMETPVSHVAYIGSVQPHKGALVFEEVVRRMPVEAYPGVRWSVYGGGDPDLLLRLRRLPQLKVRGYYRAGSLVELLRRDRVGLGLLLSIVPESYSLALSECLAAGVPVVAFDHGAIAERVRAHGGGLLVEPGAGAAGIASVLAALAAGLKPPLPAQPSSRTGGTATAGDDASAFEELYRELGLC
jgi:glycosyltransferase involved in cell wall biosynthesis